MGSKLYQTGTDSTTGVIQPLLLCRKKQTLWHITCDLRSTMRPKQFGAILLIFAAISCGRQQKMQRDQQNYDVVQEGATGTATTTLAAPGETAPPATATNVDTTTAFTLPETATTTSTAPPGTIAGSLPTSTGGSIGQSTPQPRPVARPHVERPQEPMPPMNSSTSTTAPPNQNAPTTTDAVPPTTTDTAGPPKKDKEKKQDQPPPPTDTTATSTQG